MRTWWVKYLFYDDLACLFVTHKLEVFVSWSRSHWWLVTSLSILICAVQLYLLAAAAWESAPMGKCSVWEKMQRAFVERLVILCWQIHWCIPHLCYKQKIYSTYAEHYLEFKLLLDVNQGCLTNKLCSWDCTQMIHFLNKLVYLFWRYCRKKMTKNAG